MWHSEDREGDNAITRKYPFSDVFVSSMNLIKVFLVAWMFEHPSLATRRLREGEDTLGHQNKPLGFSISDFKHVYVSTVGEVIKENSDYSPQSGDCPLLCSQETYLKGYFSQSKHSKGKGLSDDGVILLNITRSKVLQKTITDQIREKEVFCNCELFLNSSRKHYQTKRTARSIELPINSRTSKKSQTGNSLGEKESKEHFPVEDKGLALFIADETLINERNEKVYVGDHHYSDITLAIPEPLSESEDLLPGLFERGHVIETGNVTVTTGNMSLSTTDLGTLERAYFEKTISVISVFVEDGEIMTKSPTFSTTDLKVNTAVTTNTFNEGYILMTTTQKDETSLNRDLQQLNSSMSHKSDTIVNTSDVYAVFRARYPVEEWTALGYFNDEYLGLINKHWLQFHPPHHRSHYILAGLYTAVMTVGVTGNCLVIFMFIRCRSLRTPANVLVMNLALSDFFLLAKMPVFIFNCFYFGPALGAIGCEIYGFLGGLTGTVSIMTLAAIALDRYYVIVYPLDPLRRTTRQRARLCVALVWCYGCLFASLPLTGYGFSRYVPEGYLTSCSFDYLDQSISSRLFILTFFFAAWVVPFSVITFCYIRIYHVVISGSSGASSRRGQEEEKRKTEIRLAGVIVGVVGLWFFAWTPYAIIALLGISGKAHLISPLSSMIPALFCKTASCIDPYVYAVTHPRFRREFQRFFCNKQIRRRFKTSKTQCWKTESSQIPGMMIGIRHQRTDYSLSDEDIEEMVVMVDNRTQKSSYFAASTIAPEQHNLCEMTFPLDSRTNEILQHPSWFMPPRPRKDRSTSLKLTSRKGRRNMWSDPTSV